MDAAATHTDPSVAQPQLQQQPQQSYSVDQPWIQKQQINFTPGQNVILPISQAHPQHRQQTSMSAGQQQQRTSAPAQNDNYLQLEDSLHFQQNFTFGDQEQQTFESTTGYAVIGHPQQFMFTPTQNGDDFKNLPVQPQQWLQPFVSANQGRFAQLLGSVRQANRQTRQLTFAPAGIQSQRPQAQQFFPSAMQAPLAQPTEQAVLRPERLGGVPRWRK